MMSYDYAGDYLTPSRSQYWRSSAWPPSPASGMRRTGSPPRAAVSTTNHHYGATAPYSDRKNFDDAQDSWRQHTPAYGSANSRTSASPARARPESTPDYLPTGTPLHRSRDVWGSTDVSSDRGRDGTPRSHPQHTYLPTKSAYLLQGAAAQAPPRPHMAVRRHTDPVDRANDDTLGHWTSTGVYHAPPRNDPSPTRALDNASSHRAASSFTYGSPSPARGRTQRSPSMIKDPCTTFLPAVHPNASHRLTLALDLDETLVYARDGPIHVRPFAKDLLRALHDMDVEVIVWTAGERDYAQSVIRLLDPLGTIQHCVYRHHKWWTGQPGYSKNLRALGRTLSRTLLVDNTPDCLKDQPENGILVSDFEGPRNYDECLRSLLRVVADIVDRPHDPVPHVLADSPDVARRTVPMDCGGSITTWTLASDRLLDQSAYQATRYNRDSPQRSRSRGRW